MPSRSKAQQHLFGMALAHKRGELPDASPAVKRLAESLSEKQIHDFAATKTSDLPEKKAARGDLIKALLTKIPAALPSGKLTTGLRSLPALGEMQQPLNTLRQSMIEATNHAGGHITQILDPFADTMLSSRGGLPAYAQSAQPIFRQGVNGLLRQLRQARFPKLASIGLGAATLAAIPMLTASIAPKGYRAEGAVRGMADLSGGTLGMAGGAVLGHHIGQLFSRVGRNPMFLGSTPAGRMGASIGALLGIGGGIAGTQSIMGRPSWKSAAARQPFQGDPKTMLDWLQDGSAGREIYDQLHAHPDKLTGVKDVLAGNSMTVPFPALRTLGGAGVGAVAGDMLANLVTPTITGNMKEHEAENIRSKHRWGTGIGAVLGALYASKPHLKELLDPVRRKLSL